MLAAGVDAAKKGWIAIVVDPEGFVEAVLSPDFSGLLKTLGEVAVIAVDIPIGLPISPPRAADVAARVFVGPRRSSVFPTLPRDILEAASYADARRLAKRRYGIGISAQAFALAPKILEVAAAAHVNGRIVEVHPEVSFRAIAGRFIDHPKKTWTGLEERRDLLGSQGIAVPSRIGEAGAAAPDDVLDAAAGAWSARRKAQGIGRTLPDTEPVSEPLIWY